MGCLDHEDKKIQNIEEHNWVTELQNLGRSLHVSRQSLSMLSKLQHMRGGHFNRVREAKHRIKSTSANERPTHSAPYCAGPSAPEFEKHEIGKMLAMDVIEPDQTECAAPIVFAPKKDGTLRFWGHYCKVNAVTIEDS